MHIVFGTRITPGLLGRVAEWCPNCRQIGPGRVMRYGEHVHIYFIPVTKTSHLFDEVVCDVCRRAQRVGRTQYPAYVDIRENVSLDDLIRRTNPEAPAIHQRLLEREERLESGR